MGFVQLPSRQYEQRPEPEVLLAVHRQSGRLPVPAKPVAELLSTSYRRRRALGSRGRLKNASSGPGT